jgi:Fe2+ or Zn2+ uptake regulation protein
METLVYAGIARKVCHPGAAARYGMESHRHHHLVCLRCEAIVDLQDPSLDTLPLPKRKAGFHIEDYSIQFRGLCPDCSTKQTSRQSTKPSKGRRTS